MKVINCSSCLAVFFFCGLGGCTSVALRHSTLAVSSTVSAILEQQVLENIGRFIAEGDVVPSLMVLNQGTITIQNKAIPTYKLPFSFADPTKASREADLGLEMDWQEAWTTVAVVDGTDLKAIRDSFIEVIMNAQKDGTCDIALASQLASYNEAKQPWEVNKWLCIDPNPTPVDNKLISANKNWWVHKGSYHEHELWVANIMFADFVIAIADKHSQANSQKQNLLFTVPAAPALQ